MGKGLNSVLDRDEVSQGLKSTLLYRPLADTLTFGLYSYFSNDSPSQYDVKPSSASETQNVLSAS